MSATIDVLDPDNPKRILMVVANGSTSPTTGWPVGFWWAELTHPYWLFKENGYEIDIVSPDGGALSADSWSDPRDESGYSAHDLLSLGFISSNSHHGLIEDTPAISTAEIDRYDALFLVGGQSPMITFYNDERVHQLVAKFYETEKVVAVVCHATAVLLKTRLSNGSLLVDGKTWTGFANSEEQFADDYVGQKIQPFWIEDEARQLENTNFIVQGRFKAHAVRDGRLVTGQQQYSGAAAAELVVQALGV